MSGELVGYKVVQRSPIHMVEYVPIYRQRCTGCGGRGFYRGMSCVCCRGAGTIDAVFDIEAEEAKRMTKHPTP